LMLTPGQAHDLACAEPLIESADPDALIADKAYDADPFIETLDQRGITPVIPPKANRKIQRACDFALYCERNLVDIDQAWRLSRINGGVFRLRKRRRQPAPRCRRRPNGFQCGDRGRVGMHQLGASGGGLHHAAA
jgi:transposase